MNPALGYRLAGLADAEAHFGIVRHMKRGRVPVQFGCCFVVRVRADDRALVDRLAAETQLGLVFRATVNPTPGRNGKPAVQWRVSRKAECLVLVETFEAYPLWSKKSRDFAIWAQAVRYIVSGSPQGKEPMSRWFSEIRAVRAHTEREVA